MIQLQSENPKPRSLNPRRTLQEETKAAMLRQGEPGFFFYMGLREGSRTLQGLGYVSV